MADLEAFDLAGRVALVTGAGSGIGRASALRLAQAGASVVCADRNADGATATVELVQSEGGDASAEAVDVTDRDAVSELVDRVVADRGALDVLANIAGIMHRSPVLETDPDDLDRVLDINLKGVFHCCQAGGRAMVAQGSGSIVNMASAAIDQAAPGLACYGMAKAGMVQLTRILAAELGPDGVRVNAVAPGFVITPMTQDPLPDDEARDKVREMMTSFAPLRTVGQPDDIAYAVLYLASDASRYMTGQILRPNGGVAMPW